MRSTFFHLAVSEDNIQNANRTSLTTQDMLSDNPSVDKMDNDVGGGSVNEKKRLYPSKSRKQDGSSPSSFASSLSIRDSNNAGKNTLSIYNPLNYRSHLLHALEGLHRYPNYLSRWKDDDVEALEQELQRLLQQVQEQKSKTMNQREDIKLALRDFFLEHPEWKKFTVPPESWDEIGEILDPRAAHVVFRSQKIGTTTEEIAVKDAIAGGVKIELDSGLLEEWIDEEMFDVYSFPLLSKTFCHKLCLYASIVMSYLELSPQKSNNPVRSCYRNIDNLGLSWLNDLVFNLILKPISVQLYRDTELEGGDLDWRHGFIAAYSGTPTTSKPRQRLVQHTDDAEVSPHRYKTQNQYKEARIVSFCELTRCVVLPLFDFYRKGYAESLPW